MPISLELVESRDHVLSLSDEAAEALTRLGRELASHTEWWGADPEADPRERTVIDVARIRDGFWHVRVREAVGVVILRDVQLHILPKIPSDHFLYLARRSERLPRTAGDRGVGGSGQLWELVILWFLDAAEALLRRGLIRDYAPVRETLSTIRGQIDVPSAARRFYTGTLLFDCAFEDHVEDAAPNRFIRAAAAHVAAGPLPEVTRQRARRLLARLDAVGELTSDDWRWQPDRRTAYYRVPVTLARHVLRAGGRNLACGNEIVWTFLIRSPELIEDGVRTVLQEVLGPGVVTKTGVRLAGSSMTFNPDLRFWETRAVADVKYKLAAGDWTRGDLYQVLAFAVAISCSDSALLNFSEVACIESMALTVGKHQVRQISWPTGIEPETAAQMFSENVRSWLATATV